jgi:VanZ family protein
MRRAHGKHTGRWHRIDLAIVVIAAGIVYASLARPGRIDCSQALSGLLRESVRVSGSDLIGNVFAYLLLGGALGLAWGKRSGSARLSAQLRAGVNAVALCALLSFSMEAAQACMGGRVSSGMDLINNTLGAATGWLCALYLAPLWPRVAGTLAPTARQQRMLAVVALAALAWLAARSAPWLPRLDLHAARARAVEMASMMGAFTVPQPASLARDATQFLALALGLTLPWQARWPAAMAITLATGGALVASLVVARPALGYTAWWALPIAGLLAIGLSGLGVRLRGVLILIAALAAVLMFELRPGTGPAREFSWRLLVLHGNAILGMQTAAFFVWFGMTFAAAGRVVGGPMWLWVALSPVLLGTLEWLQTFTPGRTPDLSPPVLGCAGAALAAGLLSSSKDR